MADASLAVTALWHWLFAERRMPLELPWAERCRRIRALRDDYQQAVEKVIEELEHMEVCNGE